MMIRIQMLVVCFLCVLAGGAAFAEGTEDAAAKEEEKRLREERQEKAKEFRQKLIDELADLEDHPWAGEYYEGDGLGYNATLILTPSGFYHQVRGCLGIYAQDFGEYTRDDDGNFILPMKPFNKPFGESDSCKLILIPWGERVYIAEENQLVEFINSVNSRNEPRTHFRGMHFMRRGDEEKVAAGSPKLPDGYSRMLIGAPITVRIKSVDSVQKSESYWRFYVTLDGGTVNRLFDGMKLYAADRSSGFRRVEVLEAGEMESKAKLTVYGAEKPEQPKPGSRYSSVPPHRRDSIPNGEAVL